MNFQKTNMFRCQLFSPPLCFSNRCRLWGTILFLLFLIRPVRAQDHTVTFSTSDPGVSRAITNWGLDTCWNNLDNMRRGIIFMGSNNVNIIRVPFVTDAPLTNNDISPNQKAFLQSAAATAAWAGPNTRWDMNIASAVDPWYIRGSNLVYPDRWAAAIQACQRYYNRNIWMVEGFNEPDYLVNNEGSTQDLYDIFGYLQASTNFPGTLMAGGSTLNNDVALTWFKPVALRAAVGTTHCLAGSASTYVNFLQTVVSSNDVPYNPELHNVMEAIMGVEYGLKGGIWWGSAELARGNFVKACQGQRLGYADDLPKWTAAAVYRGTNGAVQAFVGESERMALPTTYRFFSKDRDVFYDGDGPRRDYTVTTTGGPGYQTVAHRNAEKVVNITWGADVQPVISGRYIVVNQNSKLALEVPGASTNNGVVLHQNTYTGASNQLWDIYPVPGNFGGDASYYSMAAAHSGKLADESNFSYNDGSLIIQWNGGTNAVEQWYFEYATNGYFKIRSRWSGKCLGVQGASTSSGAQILQWSDNGTTDHFWRLIPAGISSYDFVAPATLTGVTATATALSVQLNWNASAASDLAGYTVLRSTNSGGPYDIVARGFTNNAFTDKSANRQKTYYYVVKAADRSLNTSGDSSQVSATPTGGPALIAKYAFDGNFNDSSGNANHLTTNGAPTFVAGKYGSAMDLSGTSQYAMVPAGIMASVTNFTIAMWVNWDGGNAWQRIFDFGNDTTQYMFLSPSSGSGTLRFAITTNGGGGEQILQTTTPLATNQWTHVAVTLNSNIMRLYTNGVLAASGTNTIAPASFNPALNNLGASQYADPLFNGRLDDLAIYNYALSDTEITQLMNNLPPPPVAPGGLAATAASTSQINLAWADNSTNETSFLIERSLNNVMFTQITATSSNVTSYPDTSLSSGTTYYYRVRATNSGGISAYTAVASATTPVAAPAGLTATPGNAKVALNWNASAGATSYNVKRSTSNGGPYSTIASPSVTNYTDTGLINGATYYYVVSAVGVSGEGADSVQASATPSGMPLAHYRFELNTLDSSGHNNHGVPTGGLLYGDPKVGANSAQFDGATSFVTIARVIATNFTVAMWVRTTNTGAGSNWYDGMGLVDGKTVGTAADWGCSVLNSKFAVGIGNPDTTFSTAANINDGNWHHLGVTRDSSTGTVKLYVDGALNFTGAGATGPRTAPTDLRIGASHSPVPVFFKGNLDDLRLYDDVLAAADITTLAGLLPPIIESFQVSGTNVVLRGAGGAANGQCNVLNSTNLALPSAQWPASAIQTFDSSGKFSYTNIFNADLPAFYRLRLY